MTVWSTTLHRIAGGHEPAPVSTFPQPFCSPIAGEPSLAVTSASSNRLVVRCGAHEQVLDRPELDLLLEEIRSAWPQLQRLRRAQWPGARISEMGRFVALVADDESCHAAVLGLTLVRREQLDRVARWLDSWREPIATEGGF